MSPYKFFSSDVPYAAVSPSKKPKPAPSVLLINGVSYVRLDDQMQSTTPHEDELHSSALSIDDSDNHLALSTPSSLLDQSPVATPVTTFSTSVKKYKPALQPCVTPGVSDKEIDEYDHFDIDLPDDLSSIPALSIPTTPTHMHSPVKPTTSPSVFQFKSPIRDLRKSVRTPQGSALRKAAIDSALSSPAVIGSATRKAAIDAALSSPTFHYNTRPKEPTLLSNIDALMSSDAFSHGSLDLDRDIPKPLFDDGGLGINGCLRPEYIDPFLAHEYRHVMNLR